MKCGTPKIKWPVDAIQSATLKAPITTSVTFTASVHQDETAQNL